MSDIDLTYGPGASVAVLTQSLKAFGSKAKLEVSVKAKDDELHDAVRLRVGPTTPEMLVRLQKWLPLCFSNFAKRSSELTFEFDEAHAMTIELPPPANRSEYAAKAIGFYELAQRYLEAGEDEQRKLLAGAHWRDGHARLVFQDDADQPFRWAEPG